MMQLKSAYKFIYSTAILIGSCFLFYPKIALAQVKVSPLVIERKTERGQARGVIEITNTSNEPFRARVYAVPFTYNKDGFEEIKSIPQDLTSYLNLSPNELLIQPGQSRQIRFNSRFLPSTPTGEYRAMIFAEDLVLTPSSKNSSMGIAPRIGVAVYVRQGSTSSKLTVESANYNLQQKQIQLLVSNSGNATARPTMNWQLAQNGKIIEAGKVDETTVISGGQRNLVISFANRTRNLAAGNYILSGELVWETDNQQNKLPYNVNLTISPAAASSKNKALQ